MIRVTGLVLAGLAVTACGQAAGSSPPPLHKEPVPAGVRAVSFVRYGSPRTVLGYRFSEPPIVSMESGIERFDVYFRLNRKLPLRHGSEYPIGYVTMDGGGAGSAWGQIPLTNSPCYAAYIDAFLDNAPPVAGPGARAIVRLHIANGQPPLEATVSFSALLPAGTDADGATDPAAPYAQKLGCPRHPSAPIQLAPPGGGPGN
jgi:hypothetical protein